MAGDMAAVVSVYVHGSLCAVYRVTARWVLRQLRPRLCSRLPDTGLVTPAVAQAICVYKFYNKKSPSGITDSWLVHVGVLAILAGLAIITKVRLTLGGHLFWYGQKLHPPASIT